MLAHSSEFENVAVREEELPELDQLCLHQCPFDVRGGPENKHGKVNILLQVHSSSGPVAGDRRPRCARPLCLRKVQVV